MPSAAERSDLNPPAERASLRAFGLALLAHLLLGAALTWGISWKQADPEMSFSAELWSPTAQEAAPAPSAVEPPPPAPEPVPAPAPPPPPPPSQAVAPPAPLLPQADIALEREKKRKQKEADERKALAEKEKADKAEKAAQLAKAEKAKKIKEAKEAAEAQAKAEAQKIQAKREQEAKKLAAAEAAADAKRRQEVMDRLGTAGATGAPEARGSALQDSGPSASYSQRLGALFKRNISFPNPETIQGNPKAEVEVRVGPTGQILSARLLKSSGVAAWDTAVVRAIEKTERIPPDEKNRYVTQFPVGFGPKD